jgi:hypothetical protein
MIKKALLALPTLTLFAIGTASAQAGANLMYDGSFDLSDSGTLTSNSNWELAPNFPDGVNPSAEFREGADFSNDPGDPHMGVWFRSFEGTQGDGDEFAHAILSQKVVVDPAGDYTLSFDAKRELNFTAASFSVTFASIGSGTHSIDLLSAAPNDGNWHTYQLALFGVSAGEALTVSAEMINGEEAIGVGTQSAFVDNFVLVPEPTSLTLLGLGLGGLILARRRR